MGGKKCFPYLLLDIHSTNSNVTLTLVYVGICNMTGCVLNTTQTILNTIKKVYKKYIKKKTEIGSLAVRIKMV